LPSTADKFFLSSLDAIPFPNQNTQKYQIHFPEQHFGTKPTLKNNQIILVSKLKKYPCFATASALGILNS